MRKLKVLFLALFVALNSYAASIDDFCAIVKETMPLINSERARLGLDSIEFKYIMERETILVYYLYGWTSSDYSAYTSDELFESIKEVLGDENYRYAFVSYHDNSYYLHLAEGIIALEEFNRYVASWYEKIFENLTYSATFEEEVLRLVNIERTKRGIAPLRMHKDLQITARIKAGEMVKYNYYEHGSYPDLPDYLIKTYYNIGENIAMGQTTPAEVVRDWMNSPGHRANILEPEYVYIGVGYCANHWVQQFGFKDFVF